MSSPFSSALARLDHGLQTIQTQLEHLREGSDADEDQLRRSLADASHYATVLSELISTRRRSARELDHAPLDQLIRQLNSLRRTQRRRLKLLNLSRELRAGRVHHHRVRRTEELNQLRIQAANELLEMVTAQSQQKDLPGPNASRWLNWACGLEGDADDATLEDLRQDFPALEEFVADMDVRHWNAGQAHEARTSDEADGEFEESTTEPLNLSGRGLAGAEPAKHDALALDLLAMFERVLRVDGTDGSSRSDKRISSGENQTPASQTASSHAVRSDEANIAGDGAGYASRRGATRDDAVPTTKRPSRFEKKQIDKAAGIEFMKVVNAWHLDDGQARRLLGISRAVFRQIREGEHVNLTPETLTGISLLVAIWKGLTVLYGSRRGDKWVHRPNSNPLFDGTQPLKYMLKEGVDGLTKVRQLVGVWSGYISPDEKR